MSRKGSHRHRNRNHGPVAVISRKPPPPGPAARTAAPALPLARKPEPLVVATPPADDPAPLPRSLSLVDPRASVLNRVRAWMLDKAERWVTRHRPLPEQPTIAQLDRLRSDLASAQRRLDRLIG